MTEVSGVDLTFDPLYAPTDGKSKPGAHFAFGREILDSVPIGSKHLGRFLRPCRPGLRKVVIGIGKGIRADEGL